MPQFRLCAVARHGKRFACQIVYTSSGCKYVTSIRMDAVVLKMKYVIEGRFPSITDLFDRVQNSSNCYTVNLEISACV